MSRPRTGKTEHPKARRVPRRIGSARAFQDLDFLCFSLSSLRFKAVRSARRGHRTPPAPAAWPPFSVSLHGALPKRHRATGSSPERDVRGPLQQREDRPASSAAVCVGRAGGSWDPPSGEGVGQTTFTPPRGRGDRGSSQGTTRGYSVVKPRAWPRQGSPGRGGLVLRPVPCPAAPSLSCVPCPAAPSLALRPRSTACSDRVHCTSPAPWRTC